MRPNEKIYEPLKYPDARLNLAACLEVLSIAGLSGANVDDHIVGDCIDDLPGGYPEAGNATALLGECLLTESEAQLLDVIQISMHEILYTSSENLPELLDDPRWAKVRRCCRELLREMAREELSAHVNNEWWEEVRLRGLSTLEAYPDPLDHQALDQFRSKAEDS